MPSSWNADDFGDGSGSTTRRAVSEALRIHDEVSSDGVGTTKGVLTRHIVEWNSSKIGVDDGVSSNTDSINVNGTWAISKKKRSMSHEILKRSMTEEPLEKTVYCNGG